MSRACLQPNRLRPLLRHAIYATYATRSRSRQTSAGESVNDYDDPRERQLTLHIETRALSGILVSRRVLP
jgi:hypothetical protein